MEAWHCTFNLIEFFSKSKKNINVILEKDKKHATKIEVVSKDNFTIEDIKS